MTHENKIPTIEFDAANFPPEKRVEAYNQFVSAIYDVRPVDAPEKPFCVKTRSWIVGDLIFGDSRYDALAMVRKKGKHILPDSRQFLFVARYLSGSSHICHDGDVYDARPGIYSVVDYGREIRSISTDCHLAVVAVPHHAVGYDSETCPPRYFFDAESAAGKLLESAFNTVMDAVPEMTLKDSPQAAAFFSGALSALLQLDGRTIDAEANNRRAIRAFIDSNMFDPKLKVDTLTERFKISRATVYRQFENEGGLMAYIYNRRLDYSFRALSFGPAQRGRVSEIARKTGYSSVSHFSRAFSQKFNVTPSNIMGKFPQSETGAAPDIDRNVIWETWAGYDKARADEAEESAAIALTA